MMMTMKINKKHEHLPETIIFILMSIAIVQILISYIDILGIASLILFGISIYYIKSLQKYRTESIFKSKIFIIILTLMFGILIYLGGIRIQNVAFSLGIIGNDVDVEKGYENVAKFYYSLNPELYKSIRKVELGKKSVDVMLLPRLSLMPSEGLAVYSSKTIISLDNDSYSFKFVLLHEICHFIYQYDLNQEERDLWKKEVDSNITFFRDYSRYDINEDFADYCAVYILDDVLFIDRLIQIYGFEDVTNRNLIGNSIRLYFDASGRKIILDNYFKRVNITEFYTPRGATL